MNPHNARTPRYKSIRKHRFKTLIILNNKKKKNYPVVISRLLLECDSDWLSEEKNFYYSVNLEI